MRPRPDTAWQPWELLEAVPRRLYRRASEWRWRPGVRAPSPSDVALRAFCHPAARAGVAQVLRGMAGTVEEVRARAAAASEGRFRVFGMEVVLRSPLDWRRDPLSGDTWADLPARHVRAVAEGRDPRYPWALGRLDGVVALAQGAWLEDGAHRARWLRALEALQQDFLAHNPPGHGVQWSCPMEVALRAQNLAVAHAWVSPWRPERTAVATFGALADHVGFVEAHLEDAGRVPNNHLLGALAGLATVGLLFPGSFPGLAERCCAGLDVQLERQVHADGWSFEGSTAYHRLALELVLVPWTLRLQRGLVPRPPRRLARMFRVVRDLLDGAGRFPQLGDTDSGRSLVLRPRGATDAAFLLPLGAALCGDAGLKRPGDGPSEELAWLGGAPGVERFRRLAACGAGRSRRSGAAGLHVLRAGEAVLAVSAGGHGQRGVGGHNHNDKLGFALHVGDEVLVADPGSGSYTRCGAVRDAFRSVRAHAVPVVDGAEQASLQRPFALGDAPPCRVERLSWVHGCAVLQAVLEGATGQRRTFMLDALARVLVVHDEAHAAGEHLLEVGFPFAHAAVRLREATGDERRRASGWLGVAAGECLVEVSLGPWGRGWLMAEAGVAWRLEPALHADGYGEVRAARRAVASVHFEGVGRVRTCVAWQRGEGTCG